MQTIEISKRAPDIISLTNLSLWK